MLIIVTVDTIVIERDNLLCNGSGYMLVGKDNEPTCTDYYRVEWIGDMFCLDLSYSHWYTFEVCMVGLGWEDEGL